MSKEKIVCIDAGHSKGVNQSPINKSYIEGDRMWDLSVLLKRELEKYEDLSVITTRSAFTDNPALTDRGRTAQYCDMFISLHSNAASTPTVTGSEIIVSNEASQEFVKMAYDMKTKITELMQDPNTRSVYTRDYNTGAVNAWEPEDQDVNYYGVLRGAQEVGCDNAMIIEHGFHTNMEDTEWLLNDTNLLNLAVEEAQLIADFYGLERKLLPHPEPIFTIDPKVSELIGICVATMISYAILGDSQVDNFIESLDDLRNYLSETKEV